MATEKLFNVATSSGVETWPYVDKFRMRIGPQMIDFVVHKTPGQNGLFLSHYKSGKQVGYLGYGYASLRASTKYDAKNAGKRYMENLIASRGAEKVLSVINAAPVIN